MRVAHNLICSLINTSETWSPHCDISVRWCDTAPETQSGRMFSQIIYSSTEQITLRYVPIAFLPTLCCNASSGNLAWMLIKTHDSFLATNLLATNLVGNRLAHYDCHCCCCHEGCTAADIGLRHVFDLSHLSCCVCSVAVVHIVSCMPALLQFSSHTCHSSIEWHVCCFSSCTDYHWSA